MGKDKATNQVLLRGKSNRGLYPICGAVSQSHTSSPAVACVGQQIKSSVWHSRLGHPTNEVVHTILKSAQISFLVDSQPHVCPYCLNGKMHILPFHSTRVKSVVPFHKVHSDL